MRRFNTLDDPFVETNIETAKLYRADLEYLQARGLPLRSVLRDALRSYVQVLQKWSPAPVMKQDQRSAFIMRGMLPDGTRQPDRPDNKPVAVVIEKPRIIIQVPRERPDMAGWTKADRDAWIMRGTFPDDDGDDGDNLSR